MSYSLGKKIKLKRTELKLSQEKLSCNILSRSVLSKIENDKVTPSIYQLQYIANALGVSMEYFLKDELNLSNNVSANYIENNIESLFQNKRYITIISLYEKNLIDTCNNINSLYYIGFSYYFSDYYNESSEILKKYIKHVTLLDADEKIKYIENVSKSYNCLSKICINSKDYNKAISYMYKAKNLLDKFNMCNNYLLQIFVCNIGFLHNLVNDYDKCINLLESFLNNKPQLIDLNIIANIHLCLSTAYYNLDNYDQSILHIKRAIYFFDYIGKDMDSKECYINYINALRFSKRYDEAQKVMTSFKDKYFCKLNTDSKTTFTILNATLFFNMKKYDECINLLSMLNINKLNSLNRNCYYFLKGHIEFSKNNFAKASIYLKKCRSFFLNSSYIYDSNTLFEDLYIITNKEKFKTFIKDSNSYNKEPRKNIMVL